MKTSGSPKQRVRLVLAVDDDEDHLLAYEVAFGRERGLRLITAGNTKAAELALAEQRVDAVLLDLSIPDEGGIVLCQRIKAQQRYRHLPIIALSALPAAYYAAPAIAAGCATFLQKPTSLSLIVAEVRERLALVEGECEPDGRPPRARTGAGAGGSACA